MGEHECFRNVYGGLRLAGCEACIRADERARVVARIRHEGNQWSHATRVILLDLADHIERSGPKPGQPKEGE